MGKNKIIRTIHSKTGYITTQSGGNTYTTSPEQRAKQLARTAEPNKKTPKTKGNDFVPPIVIDEAEWKLPTTWTAEHDVVPTEPPTSRTHETPGGLPSVTFGKSDVREQAIREAKARVVAAAGQPDTKVPAHASTPNPQTSNTAPKPHAPTEAQKMVQKIISGDFTTVPTEPGKFTTPPKGTFAQELLDQIIREHKDDELLSAVLTQTPARPQEEPNSTNQQSPAVSTEEAFIAQYLSAFEIQEIAALPGISTHDILLTLAQERQKKQKDGAPFERHTGSSTFETVPGSVMVDTPTYHAPQTREETTVHIPKKNVEKVVPKKGVFSSTRKKIIATFTAGATMLAGFGIFGGKEKQVEQSKPEIVTQHTATTPNSDVMTFSEADVEPIVTNDLTTPLGDPMIFTDQDVADYTNTLEVPTDITETTVEVVRSILTHAIDINQTKESLMSHIEGGIAECIDPSNEQPQTVHTITEHIRGTVEQFADALRHDLWGEVAKGLQTITNQLRTVLTTPEQMTRVQTNSRQHQRKVVADRPTPTSNTIVHWGRLGNDKPVARIPITIPPPQIAIHIPRMTAPTMAPPTPRVATEMTKHTTANTVIHSDIPRPTPAEINAVFDQINAGPLSSPREPNMLQNIEDSTQSIDNNDNTTTELTDADIQEVEHVRIGNVVIAQGDTIELTSKNGNVIRYTVQDITSEDGPERLILRSLDGKINTFKDTSTLRNNPSSFTIVQ